MLIRPLTVTTLSIFLAGAGASAQGSGGQESAAQSRGAGSEQPPASAPDAGRPELPTAGSPEAAELFVLGCKTMAATTRGTFSTTAETDSALARGQPFPMGAGEANVDGGFRDGLRWGSTDTDRFAVHHGRMVCETEDGWKLRGARLSAGNRAPFLLDPQLLFGVLAALPDPGPGITHVEAATVRGVDCAVLSRSLTGDAAADFAGAGVVPEIDGPMIMIGGGFGGMPQKSYEVDLALYVNPVDAHVHRVRVKVYETDPMLDNVRIQVGGAGDEELPAPRADTDATATDDGPLQVRGGLPLRTPARTQSVLYYRVDFKQFGQSEPPQLDAAARRWLELN